MLNIIDKAYTFDDLLLVPAYSKVLPNEINVNTKITADIDLNIPLISAAMDTVTEHKLAISMAQAGGLGIIHKNMSIQDQAAEVRKVKKHESVIVANPVTIKNDASIADLLELISIHNVYSVPVIDSNNILVGIVTSRDLYFQTNSSQLISKIMTTRDKLITVTEGTDIDVVKIMLHKHRIEQILIVNDYFELSGMITVKDINTIQDSPNACKDSLGHLRVGAAIGVDGCSMERVKALAAENIDLVVIDTAHGHSVRVIETVKKVKQQYPNLAVIAGNIATADAALALSKAGADGVKVGIGPGSICTTRVVTGVGVPQLTAIADVAIALKDTKVKVIADGGIRFSGDISKALAAGANIIMLGNLFAGCDEAPGVVELYKGRSYKSYRGMGSLSAMQQKYGSSDRYFQSQNTLDKLVPEGIEGRVPCKGKVKNVLEQLLGGVRSSMGYLGADTIHHLQKTAKFVVITSAGKTENHPHNVIITKEAPNYHVN